MASGGIRAAAGRGTTVATFIAELSSQASVRRLAAATVAPRLAALVAAIISKFRTRLDWIYRTYFSSGGAKDSG
jgi:hypothetical protein